MKALVFSFFGSGRNRFLGVRGISLMGVLVCLFAVAARAQVVVDLSAHTGAITHGSSGWLYGQSEDGIPSDNMMAPLKPQIAAQKPPDGLQHPTGDALHIAPAFRRAGGKEIEIYLQDIYRDWPYNNPGIDDYLGKVRVIVRKVASDPNHEMFSYVPFNEPEFNWYGYSGKPLDKFLADWKAVYEGIRAIDPKARIVGPNYSIYRSATYREFLTFARDNHVMPDEMSWHELTDNFFSGWDDRYKDYRGLEASLGIAPLPIVINEYTRARGDLAVPGKLIQWIARFENSKVQACLAYWVPSGTLSDLVARTWPNRATGAWWLYKWYGGMTGDTVSVTSPDMYGFGLQGIATVDSAKRQARILFGGGDGAVDVVVRGLETAPFSGAPVHVTVWGVATSGTEPSKGPEFVEEGDYTPSDGQIELTVPGTLVSSAYYLVVTPATSHGSANLTNHYEAEYADLSGSAVIAYGKGGSYTGTGFVEGFGASGGAATEFDVTAPEDGYYLLTLHYAVGSPGAGKQEKVGQSLNGAELESLALPSAAEAGSWSVLRKRFFLAGGINRFAFQALNDGSSDGLRIDSIDLTAASGEIAAYRADDPANTMTGTARLTTVNGVTMATGIGAGGDNSLTFNRVNVPSSGRYKMAVSYTNNEVGHSGQVERLAEIGVNGGEAKGAYFRNTFSSSVIRTIVMDVDLKAGENTVRITNSQGFAPDIVEIQIAGR